MGLNTETYIREAIAQAHSCASDQLEGAVHLKKWMHDHTTTVKVIQVAVLIIGVGLLIASAVAFPLVGVLAGVSLLAAGAIMTTVSGVSSLVLKTLVPLKHDMKNHIFKPGEYGGSRLHYQGDVPILSLNAENPFLAGKAQGFLLGEQIARNAKIMNFLMHKIGGRPDATHLARTFEEIKKQIPQEYLAEMNGLIEGYREWASQHSLTFPPEITFDSLLLLQLQPESVCFAPLLPKHVYNELEGAPRSVACTAVVDRDEKEGIVFARNLDWDSVGILGPSSLIINRRTSRMSTVEVGIAGFLGTLTGMNCRGLSLAMNTCPLTVSTVVPLDRVDGMPAGFFNRRCLETCATVDEGKSFMRQNQTLAPYHLTVADCHDAVAFHFRQGDSYLSRTIERPLKANGPLIVLNFKEKPQDSAEEANSLWYSKERKEQLETFFIEAEHQIPAGRVEKGKLVAHSLSLPYVNNDETLHSVIMKPVSRSMEVAFDNGFAASGHLLKVDTAPLFA